LNILRSRAVSFEFLELRPLCVSSHREWFVILDDLSYCSAS
jgi:hypothetical protein